VRGRESAPTLHTYREGAEARPRGVDVELSGVVGDRYVVAQARIAAEAVAFEVCFAVR